MTISVVGNAESLFENNYGTLIDESDDVLRFNGGIIKNSKKQGMRTTIVAYSFYREKLYKFPPDAKRWDTRQFKTEREKLQNILATKPSNGIIVLEHISNIFPDREVRIFGFDWKETPTWYRNIPGVPEHHDYEKEKQYCLELIAKQGWRIF